MMRFCSRWGVALILIGISVGCRANNILINQRRINEWAAALEQAQRTLLAEPGLRRAGEPLPDYLGRLAHPLPGEPSSAYRARFARYLKVLEQTTAETAAARRMPALQDTSDANRALWQRATRVLSYLPGRMGKLRAAWRREREHPGSGALGAELTQTLRLMLDARAALRDACP